MKTMVQSFLVEESKELIYDTDSIEEWKAKCELLGLDNQLALSKPDKSPIPFEFMNTASMRVYETLCPAKEDYKSYRKTAIPLEVLSLVALAVQEHYFEKIQIWYDDKSPDPLAVGLVKENEWSYNHYLIARWGDVLRPFDELRDKAITIFQRSSEIKLKATIADCSNKLANIENLTLQYFDCQTDAYNIVGF